MNKTNALDASYKLVKTDFQRKTKTQIDLLFFFTNGPKLQASPPSIHLTSHFFSRKSVFPSLSSNIQALRSSSSSFSSLCCLLGSSQKSTVVVTNEPHRMGSSSRTHQPLTNQHKSRNDRHSSYESRSWKIQRSSHLYLKIRILVSLL